MTYIYICHAVSPLNSRMATKVAGGGDNSSVKYLVLASKGKVKMKEYSVIHTDWSALKEI